MYNSGSDRRKAESHPPFPFMDNEGNEVTQERRSGHDRRKNRRDSDVAGRILNILN